MSSLLGRRFITKDGYWVEVIKVKGNKKYSIVFDNGYIMESVGYTALKKGSIKNPYHPSVCNIGYIGVGKYYYKNDLSCYKKWHGMIHRCYNHKTHEKQPTYIGCTVDERWHNFQVFAEWFYGNYRAHMDDSWHLDKDIIIGGNKTYSPETCAFVPLEINYLIVKYNNNLFPGVKKEDYGYSASINKYKINTYLGYFKTPEEAFNVFKYEKEKYVEQVAEQWKDLVDIRIYQSLIDYKLKI